MDPFAQPLPGFHPPPASLPPGRRAYAIGDIHGSADRLRALHAAIAADLAARPVASPLLIHLGDYVDKGGDARAVLDYLSAGDPIPGVETLFLIGNHEESMLAALSGDRGAAADWMWGGGEATLASYGIDPASPREDWAAQIPSAHLAFLRQRLRLSHREGGYLFVHAGIRPGLPLEAQAREDLLRIRHDFLNSEADFGCVVVHGHTARHAPVVKPNRIGIDTAAWSGGPLTCLVLEASLLGFIQG